MPRIIPYEQRVSSTADIGGRAARASDFGGGGAGLAQAGKELESFAGQLYDQQQRQEVSDVAVRMAKARADWTVELQNRALAAPAGDTSFAEKFKTDFADFMAKQGEGLSTVAGRRAFQQNSAELAAHFVERVGVFQANSIAAKAVQDYNTLVDANRSTLLNDPTQYEAVLKSTIGALRDPNGIYYRMPAAKREELARTTHNEIGLSAVQGLIRQDPEGAKQQLEQGLWDKELDADKKAALLRGADFAINAKRVEQARAEKAKQDAEDKAREAIKDGFVKRIFGDNPDLTVNDVLNSDLKSNEKEHFVRVIQTATKPEKITTDATLVIKLWDRIHLPDDHPDKLRDEMEIDRYFGRGLTAENINMLRGEMRGRRTTEGAIEADLRNNLIKTARRTLSGSNDLTGFRDPKGDEQVQRFMSFFLPEYQRQRAAGKTAVQLLDPDSPDYLGKAIGRFTRTPAEYMKDLMNANPTNPAGVLGGPQVPAGKEEAFTPEGRGYDYARARAAGMGPDGTGENAGHWGSVAETTRDEQTRYGLPEESYVLLKGRSHETWDKAVAGEKERGFSVVKLGDRYFSVKFESQQQVIAMFKAGKLSREEAAKILREKGWAR